MITAFVVDIVTIAAIALFAFVVTLFALVEIRWVWQARKDEARRECEGASEPRCACEEYRRALGPRCRCGEYRNTPGRPTCSAPHPVSREELNAVSEQPEQRDLAGDAILRSLEIRDGQLHIGIQHRVVFTALIQMCEDMFKISGATNYVQQGLLLDLGHGERGYTLTVQRATRPTPHELRTQAERERDAAIAERNRFACEVDRLQGHIDNICTEFSAR